MLGVRARGPPEEEDEEDDGDHDEALDQDD
jgi:hypothetical protein